MSSAHLARLEENSVADLSAHRQMIRVERAAQLRPTGHQKVSFGSDSTISTVRSDTVTTRLMSSMM